MKILIITQRVDKNDSVLGFMHGWLLAFAQRMTAEDRMTVICLEKGQHDLPENAKVFSLGKEDLIKEAEAKSKSRLAYMKRFYKIIWHERKQYDTVFIHMNQEYAVLGGWLWKLLGKKVLLWRNHPQGDFLTRLAVGFSDHVFCTSPSAYVKRFKRTAEMPVGIDTSLFSDAPDGAGNAHDTRGAHAARVAHAPASRIPNSVISPARLSPVKKLEVLIEALKIANSEGGLKIICDIYGDAPARDQAYAEGLRAKSLPLQEARQLRFFPAVPNVQLPALYRNHEFYVNATPSGSFDKAIFEAMACGTLVLVSNCDFAGILPEECIFAKDDSADLAKKLRALSAMPEGRKQSYREAAKKYITERQSLDCLIGKLFLYF